jgi:hypothetical protein
LNKPINFIKLILYSFIKNYTMAYSSMIALSLVGKPRSEYQCNHVVNQVLYGSKNYGGRAKDYLNYGTQVYIPSAGTVVVGKDGVHVGIFISDTEFIHSSSNQKMVVIANKIKLPYVFPGGYELRR